MSRTRAFVARWGLLMVAMLAGAGLALHERTQAPSPPGRYYSVDQVLDGVRADPSAWLGHTFWVRGLWWDVCGDRSELAALYRSGVPAGPGPLCAMTRPGQPWLGLADRLPGEVMAIHDGPWGAWWHGGPLGLDGGVPAHYLVTLSVESPCRLNDGGTDYVGPPVPPGAKPCPVGSVIEAWR